MSPSTTASLFSGRSMTPRRFSKVDSQPPLTSEEPGPIMTYMTTHTSALSQATPAEIDTELARLWEESSRYSHWLASTKQYANADAKRSGPSYWESINGKRAAETIAQYEAKLLELEIEEHPYNVEYVRRGGWLRYFLVKNTNGHVHREMNCNTCFPTTQYGWLPSLSDCDEDAMIEEWGELACTVCFPSAPANPNYNRPSRRDAEALAARQAEKAARQAAKDAKAIYDPETGGPLKVYTGRMNTRRDGTQVPDYEEYKTKVAARNALSGAVKDLAWQEERSTREIQQLVPALEAVGIDTAKVIANALKAAGKDGRNVYKINQILRSIQKGA